MSRYAADGKTLVYWVTTIANKAAPTVAELNAGTRLSGYLTKDGLDIALSQNSVDNADLEDTFDATDVGTFGGTINLTLFRDDTADTAWNLFVYGTSGYLVVREGPLATVAWTAAQKAQVYPARMHEPVPVSTTSNEQRKFKVMLPVTDQPSLKATVAA